MPGSDKEKKNSDSDVKMRLKHTALLSSLLPVMGLQPVGVVVVVEVIR